MKNKILFLTTATALLALSQTTYAANINWGGGGVTDDWNDTANWGGTNPSATSGDQALFNGAGDTNTPTADFAFTNPNDISQRNDALVTIESDVDISGFGSWRMGANANNNGAAVAMTGGSISGLSFTVASSPNATSRSILTVSGGALTTTAGFNIGSLGTFNLTGNAATFSADTFSLSSGSIFNATFNSSGISAIAAANAFSIGDATTQLNLDLSAFSGTGTFDLVTFGSITGAYDSGSVTGLGSLSGGRTATLGYDADSMFVNIVPEPSAFALTGLSLAGVLLRRRRA